MRVGGNNANKRLQINGWEKQGNNITCWGERAKTAEGRKEKWEIACDTLTNSKYFATSRQQLGKPKISHKKKGAAAMGEEEDRVLTNPLQKKTAQARSKAGWNKIKGHVMNSPLRWVCYKEGILRLRKWGIGAATSVAREGNSGRKVRLKRQ